jgi:hypothetical protein
MLSIRLEGLGDLRDERREAFQKAKLMNEVYRLETVFE